MKNLLTIIILMALCFVFNGCPYETNVPIDAPSIKINPKLLGTWEDRKNKNEIYEVSKQDEFTYSIVKKQKEKKENETYFAYTSIVNETTFLNLWENKPNDISHSFSLYKMEVKNDYLLTITEVTENIDEKFSSSEELKKFVAANMKNSYFFGKEEKDLIRTGK